MVAERKVHEAPPAADAAEARTGDIYAVLGVSADASATMALALYWERVRELRELEQEGVSGAAEQLAELNTALEIFLDRDRRTAYDRARATQTEAEGKPKRPRRKHMARASLLAFAFGASLTLLCAFFAPLFATLVVGPAALVISLALLLMRAPLPEPTPLEILELDPDATPDDIDLAYRTIASAWLSRVHSDPEAVVVALDRLDRAYVSAVSAAVARRDGTVQVAPIVAGASHRRPALRAGGAVALRGGLAAARLGWRLGGRGVAAARGRQADADLAPAEGSTMLRRAGAPADAEAPTPLRPVAALNAPSAPSAPSAPTASPGPIAPTAPANPDVELRLSNAFRSLGTVAARHATSTSEESAQAPIYLVLEAGAGRRRVPVERRPVTMGTGGECDLVVATPEPGAPAQELARVWRNGNALLMHARPGLGNCRVNGESASWARLEPGDVIEVGSMRLLVEQDQSAS